MVGLADRRILYGGTAVIAAVVLAALAYRWSSPSPVAGEPSRDDAGAIERPSGPPRAARRPVPQVIPEDNPPRTAIRREEAAHQLGEARRRAATGDFTGAEEALRAADRIAPDQPETAAVAAEIAELKTPRGRLTTLTAQARRAIDYGDIAAAIAAIGEIERLDSSSPALAQLRRDLAASQSRVADRDARIRTLVAAMREALARRDFAAAYRALNEAERLDVQNAAVQDARAELNRIQDTESR